MAATHPIFTIGHSTKPIAAFVELLRVGKVASVVDIRSVSRSRANPQYNRDVLPAALASCQIGYEGLPELGGLRKTSKSIPPEIGRAHVCTPVTNAHHVCRLLLEKK